MMTRLPRTPELLAVAQRVVWFRPPGEALDDGVHFLAHVMTYGAPEDLSALSGIVGPDDFREVLAAAPPGIFDPRSWAYWHVLYGKSPAPPLRERRLP
jgi:hypothetical protein